MFGYLLVYILYLYSDIILISLKVSVLCVFSLFFFFKQKTADELRISDWSSDVCSSDLTLMFQLEVAERIVAPVGTNAYGRLAVLAQWRSHAKIAMKVHRSAFTPPPKIMSAIVHVTPGDQPAGVEPKLLSKLTEKGFGQRRKMLRQSLKGIEGAVAAADRKSTRLNSSH